MFAHRRRAIGVALVWILGLLPLALGPPDCPFAEVFGVPCPGCGMTRAVMLLAGGDVSASLRMHALALPSLAASVLLMGATVWVTGTEGSPARMWQTRLGRVSVVAFAGVQAAIFGLWVARMFGCFGGPVPV